MADAIDKVIAARAARQYGYVTRQQLLAIGLGRQAIKYRVAAGRLIPVYAGVYAVGSLPVGPVAGAFAALLACGEKAVLSHGSAASLWGFNKHWDRPHEVTAPALRTRKGIKVHRSRMLSWRDITRQLGVPVTTPARTVLDNAPRLRDKRLSRMVNDARHAGYLHLHALADVLNRNPHHPGTRRLRPFVEQARNPTRSPLEDDFLAFAERFGLPKPVTNTYLLGHEVDVLYPAEKVIVEIDGYEYHADRASFRRDRKRDAVMLAEGFLTVRITDDRMEHEAEQEAERLQRILEQRRAA
jgi:very-short-patch-repair endonuclease